MTFLSAWQQLSMLHGMIPAALIYLLPLQKRPHWVRRGIVCALAMTMGFAALRLLAGRLFPVQAPALYLPAMFVSLTVQLGLVVVWFCQCGAVSWQDALYGTVCAYATQHLADAISTLVFLPAEQPTAARQLWNAAILLAVLAVCYFGVARRLPVRGRYEATLLRSAGAACLVLLFAMVLNFCAKVAQHVHPNPALFRIGMAFDILCCVFVLWVQADRQRQKQLAEAMALEREMRIRQRQQYEMARESVERINRKCHDLKHQIARIRTMPAGAQQTQALQEMEQAVLFYDFMIKSGNPVIDTVLTETQLLCEQSGITFTCMANGPAMDFMDAVDLYVLFDSALRHAVQQVQQVQNPRQRMIAVTLHQRRNTAVLQIEHYFAGPGPETAGPHAPARPDMLRDIPVIARKYGGMVQTSAQDHTFILCVTLPVPRSGAKHESPMPSHELPDDKN